MRDRSALRVWLAAFCVFALVGVACGQKDGVFEQGTVLGGSLGGGAALPEGVEVNAEGQVIDSETGEVLAESVAEFAEEGGLVDPDTGTAIGPSTDDGSAPGNDDPSDPGTDEQPDPSDDNEPEPSGGDSTGVTANSVVIGSHAPLTGAAPVPSDAADKGKDLYFRWLEDQNKDVVGRKVSVILKNDNYNPSQAVAVCKEMVEKDKVFLLSGSAGTDQIQACARYAASVNVPYLSAGVTENGLTTLPNYFATSMTYPDQAPLLADFMASKLGASGEKNGMLWFDTANFRDAHDAFVDAMDKAGVPLDYDKPVSKNAGISEANTAVQEMKTQGVQNVYVLTSPTWYLQVLSASGSQQYNPQWVGVGITMTFDTVANIGCKDSNNAIDKAKFFSPFPAFLDAGKFDPDFYDALALVGESQADPNRKGDFILLGWMGGKSIAQMFELVGRDLTRERFVHIVERARNIKTGLGPPLSFAPTDHFGADVVHVNEATCGDARWHTRYSFVRDF